MTTTLTEVRRPIGPPPPTPRLVRWIDEHRKWVFTLPAMTFVAILIVFPIVWTVRLSLTDASGSVRADADFVGVRNYVDVLTDTGRFWPAVGRTFAFTGAALLFEVVLGMAIALLLWRPFRGQRWVRIAILLPLVATPVAVGMMWRLILDPTIGLANQLLAAAGLPAQPWLAGEHTALPTVVLIDVWQWTPMVALILLAGLTTLPNEPDEAARIDGAGPWQRFWHITLPLLRPTLVVAVLLRGIDAMKTFDVLYATKGRGGGSFHEVETLNVYAYGLSFDYYDYGRSSTVLILFFVIILGAIWALTARNRSAARSRTPKESTE